MIPAVIGNAPQSDLVNWPGRLTRYLGENMPLVSHLGLSVAQASPDGVRLSLALGPNLNHQKTAFGGSISTAGILAAWSLLWIRCQDAGLRSDLVIADSQTRFIRPVIADFHAICPAPADAAWTAFLGQLQRKGKARLELRSEIHCNERVVASHDGTFVASLA